MRGVQDQEERRCAQLEALLISTETSWKTNPTSSTCHAGHESSLSDHGSHGWPTMSSHMAKGIKKLLEVLANDFDKKPLTMNDCVTILFAALR